MTVKVVGDQRIADLKNTVRGHALNSAAGSAMTSVGLGLIDMKLLRLGSPSSLSDIAVTGGLLTAGGSIMTLLTSALSDSLWGKANGIIDELKSRTTMAFAGVFTSGIGTLALGASEKAPHLNLDLQIAAGAMIGAGTAISAGLLVTYQRFSQKTEKAKTL